MNWQIELDQLANRYCPPALRRKVGKMSVVERREGLVALRQIQEMIANSLEPLSELIETPDEVLARQLDNETLHPAVLSGEINSKDCHKFEGCSAPVCPLDARSMRAPYYDGEPVCHLLSEYSKPTAKDDLRGAIGDELYEVIGWHYPIVFERYGPIRKRLKRASATPSRLGGVRDKD